MFRAGRSFRYRTIDMFLGGRQASGFDLLSSAPDFRPDRRIPLLIQPGCMLTNPIRLAEPGKRAGFPDSDLTRDPPLSKMDLISCRNLLIYLNAVLQRRVLAVLNYALQPSGCLLLGNSESLGSLSDHFVALGFESTRSSPGILILRCQASTCASRREAPLCTLTGEVE